MHALAIHGGAGPIPAQALTPERDKEFRAALRSALDTGYQVLETGGTSLGIPDSNYLSKTGVEGWVEFKWTDGWAVTLRDMQVGWLLRRARYGGRCWVAVRRLLSRRSSLVCRSPTPSLKTSTSGCARSRPLPSPRMGTENSQLPSLEVSRSVSR